MYLCEVYPTVSKKRCRTYGTRQGHTVTTSYCHYIYNMNTHTHIYTLSPLQPFPPLPFSPFGSPPLSFPPFPFPSLFSPPLPSSLLSTSLQFLAKCGKFLLRWWVHQLCQVTNTQSSSKMWRRKGEGKEISKKWKAARMLFYSFYKKCGNHQQGSCRRQQDPDHLRTVTINRGQT